MTSPIAYLETPIGQLKIVGDGDALKMVIFTEGDEKESLEELTPIVANAKEQLKEYFEGKREKFDLELSPEGTDFQRSVWDELLKVPFGKTSTYAKQSIKLGDIKKIRAVGTANGKNPISIIIPCHRIIGSDGSLTGYAGGLHRKEWLLKHERALPRQEQMELF